MDKALAYALAAAAATLAGAVVVVGGGAFSARVMRRAVALAAGFLVAVALVGLLPEALSRSPGSAGLVALGGFVLVHLVQQVVGRIAPHGAHGEGHVHVSAPSTHQSRAGAAGVHASGEPHGAALAGANPVRAVASIAALGALVVHTLLDGVALASAQGGEARLGSMVFVGVLLHKFPEGLAVAGLFIAAGFSRTRAMLAAGVLAASIIAGVLITNSFHPQGGVALAVSAGVTLYVGAAMLVPEARDRADASTAISFVLGAAFAVGARLLMEGR